jgi:hypothetical protein
VATARETLHSQVLQIASTTTHGQNVLEKVNSVAQLYRIQSKIGIVISSGRIARDELSYRIVQLIQSNSSELAKDLWEIVDDFRMQYKDNVPLEQVTTAENISSRPPIKLENHKTGIQSQVREKRKKDAVKSGLSTSIESSDTQRRLVAQNKKTTNNTAQPFNETKAVVAVSGGPRLKKHARSECPKCRSFGVVLARNYIGDDYFSCVYCGWQAFRGKESNDQPSNNTESE